MWIWSLAILLASRSYAQARLGHIDREKEHGGDPYNVANTMQLHRTCKVDNNAPVNCMHTLAHCSPQEAFETTAHEILPVVLLLRNHKQVREPGDDVDSRQSQVDRKSYIAFARPFVATNIYVYHLFARSDTRSPSVLKPISRVIRYCYHGANFLNVIH